MPILNKMMSLLNKQTSHEILLFFFFLKYIYQSSPKHPLQFEVVSGEIGSATENHTSEHDIKKM